jgi:dihydroorotase
VFHLQPPLRTSADRAALREALAQGLLAVSADHRAHGADAKAAPFARTAPGAAGFEAVLPVLAALVREEAIGLAAALGAVTHLPASLLGIPGGTLAPGASADLCVYDPAREWTVGPDTWRSAGTATPVWGRTLRGRVLATLAGGATVHDPQGLFA